MTVPQPLRRYAAWILQKLRDAYPESRCALNFKTPFQLLVATVLSAQCTDVRVNEVTKALFTRYPDATSFAGLSQERLERHIRPTGFYRNKARHIREAAKILVKAYGGDVPRSLEALIQLPGVARKTANVVLASGFGIHEGIAVDTHVLRLSQRLGLSSQTTPERVEKDLQVLFDGKDWGRISLLLIDHGRQVCQARSMKCGRCCLAVKCPSRTPVPGARK